jgi:hypothetical protein
VKRISLLVLLSALVLAGSDVSAKTRVCGSGGKFLNVEAIGLTADQRLVCFSERKPSRARAIGAVSGLDAGELLVGIDFRPATGQLYGVGSLGGLYVIDPATAVAVKQMAPISMPLMGTSFGVDFNPVPDRLRIVSDAGQNLRVNVMDGMATLDMPLAPADAGVTAAAYTNNDADMNTGTVLYDIATAMPDRLLIQAPPNNGSLNPVGNLPVDSGPETGFDVYSEIRDGTTLLVKGLAVLRVGGVSQLFLVDLNTGSTRLRGSFPAETTLVGLAIPLVQGR